MSDLALVLIILIPAALLVLLLLWSTRLQQRPYREEAALAKHLASTGTKATGRVTAWERQLGGVVGEVDFRITIEFEVIGENRETSVFVRVEDEVVARFSPGSTVHVLVDPAKPDCIAIDRELSPVSVPRSWEH